MFQGVSYKTKGAHKTSGCGNTESNILANFKNLLVCAILYIYWIH